MARGNTGLFLSALLFLAGPVAAQECSTDWLDLRDGARQMRFSIEIADDQAERAQGLMFRKAMPAFSGMLFVYPQPQQAVFWMKNTEIPLDMIFADASGTVTRIIENAEPFSTVPRDGGGGVQYVLELNAGTAAKLGIAPGAQMRSAAMDSAVAAWPCPG